MTPDEIRAIRERLGLSKGQAARLFGITQQGWVYLENGRNTARGPLARLLRLAAADPAVVEALRGMEGED